MSDRDAITEYKKHKDRHTSKVRVRKPFAGVDGEGGDINEKHEYLLLRAGDHVLETGFPLTTDDCLNFLTCLPQDKIWVSFFFDYDVTMMLRGMPEERLRRLLDTDCRRIPGKPCSSFPVDYLDYQIDYRAKKEFKVRRRTGRHPETGKLLWTPWTIIHDTGSFFQTSFVKALRAWFDEPEMAPVIDKIAEGKEMRAEFGAVTQDEREYNHMECILLARMMEKFRDMADRADIRPNAWQGPGNLVSAVMKREKLPRNSDITLFDTSPDLVKMANDGYYGGRFEMSVYGPVPGPIYQYDINSAYANTYKNLPCLIHGIWEWVPAGKMPINGVYVGEVSFKHKAGLNYNTLPLRGKHDGALLFPGEGRGTYWSPELEVAKQYASLEWHGGFRYRNNCTCESFQWVYDIYRTRKELKRMGDGSERVLKLVLASTYGKLAQSIGCAPYSNPMWASLIVSQVRATLINGVLSLGNGGHDVLMLATDGIFCTESRSELLPIGSELGEWEETTHPEIFNVQSGIYFIPGHSPKTRGTPQQKVAQHEHDFRNRWEDFVNNGTKPSVEVSVHTFMGLAISLARNKPEIAGSWIDSTKSIDFDYTTKRYNGRFVGSTLYTDPIPGSPNLRSEPYSRVIGGLRAEERLLFASQPDWGDTL